MKENIIFRFLETSIRFTLVILAIIILSILLLPICYCFKSTINFLIKKTSRLYLYILGVKLKIIGSIPKDKQYEIVGNHTSLIEILILPIINAGQKGTVFINKRLLKLPILGWWLKLLDPVAIDPKTGDGVLVGIKKAIKIIKEKKINFFAFPEGQRTTTGEIKEFKSGVFLIAIQSEIDIIPFGSAGAFEFKPKNRWYIKPGKVVIYINKPVPFEKGIGRDRLALLIESNVRYCAEQAKKFM